MAIPRATKRRCLAPSLATCPPEVNHHIFSLACTDGGKTARALRHVSKYIGQVAGPFIWRTVAVSGLQRIQQLATRMEKYPGRARMIEDLFISDRLEEDSLPKPLPVIGRSKSDDERYKEELLRRKAAEDAEAQDLMNVMRQIFPTLAPTLRTACIISFNQRSTDPIMAIVFSQPLPNLTELTISGRSALHFPPNPIPNLKRLFLSSYYIDSALYLPIISSRFPGLTHLRLRDGDMRMVRYLEVAYGIARPNTPHALPPQAGFAELPSDLTTFCIDTPEAPEPHWCGHAHMVYYQAMDALEDLERMVPDIILIGGREGKRHHTYSQAKEDWSARRAGEEGPWSASAARPPVVEAEKLMEVEVGLGFQKPAKSVFKKFSRFARKQLRLAFS